MGYRGKKLNYVIHNNYNWPYPWIFALGRHVLPPKELSQLNSKWLTFNLNSNEIFSKGNSINEFSSQKMIMDPLLESFIRQNELFTTYNSIKINSDNVDVDFFKDDKMPATNSMDCTWNHDLITTGLEYNKNSTWITMKTRNGIKNGDIYKFHFRIFRGDDVKRADITVQNGKVTSEVESKNSIKINEPMDVNIKQNKLIVKIPVSLLSNATGFMYNVDIIEKGSVDRSSWLRFDIVK